MANYKWPNVYPTIKDLSGVVATNSVTACAYVGEAEFGPINKPTLLSTLKDYTNKFGALNSAKYGYAGYSLAVASESIDTHYFVRVVKAGEEGAHETDDAMYASVKLPKKGSAATPTAEGYYVEEITNVETKEDASSLFEGDTDNALIVVANNPNNLKLFVALSDTTINENKAYPFTNIAYTQRGETNVYDAVMTGAPAEVLDEIVVGDDIEITRVTTQGGIYTVTAKDDTAKTITFEYKAASAEEADAPVNPLAGGKVSKYPEPSERTFQIDVKQTIGRVTASVETYQYCTLYQHKDNYGNSTFVEDVINGSSDYIKVYVNPNLLNALDEGEVLEVALSNQNIALGGGKAGGRPTSKELNAGWDLFEDRNQTSVSLLMNSGYSHEEETSYQNKMLAIAEKRRDCFCLFDIPMSKVEAEDAIDWRKNIFGSNSYRGALSSPWVRTYDSVAGRAGFVMCPSAFVAKLIGQAGDPWNAPAGPNRGIISSATVSPTGLTQTYDSVVGGTLYADNQINCIIRDVAAGYVNWGQRTLQQKPSALDRINVARTVIYIETILRDAARWHLFQNNTPYERMQITLQFSAFLDTILSADGIAGYQVICDKSNNTPIVIQNNQLVIDVILTPVYAAESIILNTTITGADASVTVSSTAN